MKIGITYNAKPLTYSALEDEFAERDDISTIHAIHNSIQSAGYETILIEADEDAHEKLKEYRPDFVFNIAEGLHGECRESHIPSMLEHLKIPYSGSGPLALGMTLDKAITKQILRSCGIATPIFQVIRNRNYQLRKGLEFPMIVKPNNDGSSRGITNNSLVYTPDRLREEVEKILLEYKQPALVEEYLVGREFTVSLLGNDPVRVLPIVEIDFSDLPPGIHHMDSYEVKWHYDSPENPIVKVVCPARFDDPCIEKKIKETAKRTYNTLGCLDFSRIDIRLDQKHVPHIIEVNAIPGLIPNPEENSRFPKACYAAGMTYEQMILAILNTGLKRYGINETPKA